MESSLHCWRQTAMIFAFLELVVRVIILILMSLTLAGGLDKGGPGPAGSIIFVLLWIWWNSPIIATSLYAHSTFESTLQRNLSCAKCEVIGWIICSFGEFITFAIIGGFMENAATRNEYLTEKYDEESKTLTRMWIIIGCLSFAKLLALFVGGMYFFNLPSTQDLVPGARLFGQQDPMVMTTAPSYGNVMIVTPTPSNQLMASPPASQYGPMQAVGGGDTGLKY